MVNPTDFGIHNHSRRTTSCVCTSARKTSSRVYHSTANKNRMNSVHSRSLARLWMNWKVCFTVWRGCSQMPEDKKVAANGHVFFGLTWCCTKFGVLGRWLGGTAKEQHKNPQATHRAKLYRTHYKPKPIRNRFKTYQNNRLTSTHLENAWIWGG